MVSSPRSVQEKRQDQAEVDTDVKSSTSPTQHSLEMEMSGPVDDGEDGTGTGELEMEEKTFLASLYRFMEERSTPIERIPHLGFKQINLWRIYKAVDKLGGYDSVTARRLWKNVYDELGGSPGSTSAATCTRRHYEKLVLPFERQLRGEEDKPLPPAKPRKQYKKSPDSKNSKAEGRKKRNQLEPESQLGAEEKSEDDVHCEAGMCTHPVAWTLPADRPQSDLCGPQMGLATMKDKSATACPVSQLGSGLFPSMQSSGGEVISPLEKKKRMAQASLGLSKLSHSPEKDSGERPSVIHCAQSPGLPRSDRPHGSSEASPVPQSSPSTSRSSSPCSVSSDDCQAILDSTTCVQNLVSQTPSSYVGNFTSVSYTGGVYKPVTCYPNVKDAAGYLRHRRDFLQVEAEGVKGQRADSSWSPNCKGEDINPLLKPHQTSSSNSSSAGYKPNWIPTMSNFTKVHPKTLPPRPFQPGYKLPQNLKRPAMDEMTAYGKKLQQVPPLYQGDLKEKFKPSLPKPLPTQHPLFHSHASMEIPYCLPSYGKTRSISGHQLKGLQLPPLFVPTQLTLPATQPNSVYHRIVAGAAYSVPLEAVRPYPYPLPIWQPQVGYTIAGLHPQYPNTKL
ncbi:AT-rich interactive domain-containing protein 5A isoform X2 [Brienomyrus brachyistius]|uniref:AT-rich interactive domain-containing protein 5A isoform X2 n=1 Tax=Brienomyrus brachyistius TaxID=42636 RepID=UPI0020B283A5|nr:AT-rich interactive domain-containing protein 5A isoform X2 [Brienomyrus brachyistius]